MMTAEQELGLVRPNIVAAVEALQSRGMSRMDAYQALGSMLGKSQTWVRKVIGRQPDAAIYLRDALNIRTAYERLCARIEAAADEAETNNNALREELHAALAGAAAPLSGTDRNALAASPAARGPARREAPSPLVRSAVGKGALPSLGVNDLPLWRAIEGE
ncbi:hypothetical protein [Methylobacterium sp. E-045]|uniref:hypothetical protein n=1 Tax=Methylobacterium sp. E-045 TaxID=2836575 RepID=UPI001FBBAEC9|nr:hypothetical protein [Methylobacterium sp. E-045]MCJ2129251.1 hypothetical protein [Methylobacterium sp. E-045]